MNRPARIALALSVAAAFTLAGCTTLDPYTDEERTARATLGAGIGAAAGAAAGALTGSDSRDRRRRALIGAGIGALSGGAVGAYMDRQAEELRQQLRGTGVSVTRDGDNIILNMPGHVTFGFDSADLRSDFFEVLDSVAVVAKEYDQTMIEVGGPYRQHRRGRVQPTLVGAPRPDRGPLPEQPRRGGDAHGRSRFR